MRILVTFIGGSGHLNPMLPIVRAAAAGGHDVLFAVGPSMLDTVRRLGFPVERLGLGDAAPPQRLPARDPDDAHERQVFRDEFVLQGSRLWVPRIEPLCARWRPDVLLVDDANFGGMIAAERLGLPHATVQVLSPGSFVRPEVIGDVLDQARAEHDLAPDPGFTMVARHLLLSPFPPGFRAPDNPLPPTGRAFRTVRPATRGDEPPPWTRARPGAPTVYFTLGTIYNMECGDLFARVLAGLADLPVNALVTVGQHIDPAEFGPQPDHVRVERFVPQESVLPWCDLVISHGGSGSVVGTLTHGLPTVLLPLGADQPYNARRCDALGVGVALDPVTLTASTVHDAVSQVLAGPGYRAAAARLRDEIAALPEPGDLVPLLESLTTEKADRQVASS